MSLARELERLATEIAKRYDPVAALNSLVADVARLENRLADAEDLRERSRERIRDLEIELEELTGGEDVLELIRDHRRGLLDLEELYDRTVGS
jgi:septal ring factor EnvC (AmiA/AmiB activator)